MSVKHRFTYLCLLSKKRGRQGIPRESGGSRPLPRSLFGRSDNCDHHLGVVFTVGYRYIAFIDNSVSEIKVIITLLEHHRDIDSHRGSTWRFKGILFTEKGYQENVEGVYSHQIREGYLDVHAFWKGDKGK